MLADLGDLKGKKVALVLAGLNVPLTRRLA